MEYEADYGEKLEAFSPNIPNAEYFQQAKMLLMLIGIIIGVPYVEMMMDAESTNFSGFRGALDTARRNWRKLQNRLREHLHEPVYRWKVRQWLADDAILDRAARRSGINIFSHDWRPPSWPYIQPVDDAAGQLLRVRNGLISPRRLHSEMSQDWQEIATETIEDNAFAIRQALATAREIEAETGEKIHWRELLALPMPEGVQITAPITVGSPGGNNEGNTNE
jgi:capsid protein